MIEIKQGNLFDAPTGYICHQVNCRGVMGKGVAKTFKEKYPEAFTRYNWFCNNYTARTLLGKIMVYKNTICMFAQDDYRGQKRNTNYIAFDDCCSKIKEVVSPNDIINMPYGIGCGLGGGDWEKIFNILLEQFKDYSVILWKLT